ncbi:transglutaminase-like cysteine peptidase [Nioella aestuarii]|uniref:transglutaminase-like cysteine peptidase n=1 Tax=Nioella aestuarii TaxID=1662864 RepID=UPI003D7FE959
MTPTYMGATESTVDGPCLHSTYEMRVSATPWKPFISGLARRIAILLCLTVASVGMASRELSASSGHSNTGTYLPERAGAQAPQGAQDLCTRFTWACARGGQGSSIPSALMATVRAVNLAVNRSVRPIEDEIQYGVSEHWALPTQRGGDCEDFALLKMMQLIERGVPANALLLATVLDRSGGSHAVLIVRTDQGDMVLDNLTNRVVDWRSTGYTFLRIQNPANRSQWRVVNAGGIFGTS